MENNLTITRKSVRRDAFHICFATLIYMFLASLVMECAADLIGLFAGNSEIISGMDDNLYMIITCMIALVWILVCQRLWKTEVYIVLVQDRKIKVLTFLFFIALLYSINTFSSLFDGVYEHLFNFFGYTAQSQLDSATESATTFLSVLYGDIAAPVLEEIVFRGMICKSLEKYGKWFAIATSALMFAIMHGNISQFLFAFLIGLLLGYTALEYGLIWSVLLHMFNNGIMGDASYYLLSDDANAYLTIILAFVGMIYFLSRIKRIIQFCRENRTVQHVGRWFYSSGWFWGLVIVWIIQVGTGLTQLE
ncbi:MAG: CPBP family intramembrane metalloprotease [Eubacterium sp.]|nr:CPBP family intramembrane metalloprotease [Eubacterium sp.]